MHKIEFVFPPVNLSYVNLTIRPVEEPGRAKEKSFPPLQWIPVHPQASEG